MPACSACFYCAAAEIASATTYRTLIWWPIHLTPGNQAPGSDHQGIIQPSGITYWIKLLVKTRLKRKRKPCVYERGFRFLGGHLGLIAHEKRPELQPGAVHA